MSSRANYITEDALLNTSYGMLTLTSLFVLARLITNHINRPKRWLLQDGIIYFAFALYIAMMTMYIMVTPILFRLTAVGEKRLKPYPELKTEHKFMVKVFFVNSMMLWFILWTIKFSFLILYRKLMEGLHNVYIKLWWAIVGFCFFSLVGCVISHMTACSSMKAWFTPGACQTPRDVRSQIASLYYTYAVDVLTDLMIMGLPIRLIWNLQMPRGEKMGIMALFGIGTILITVATLRVAQIGSKSKSSNQPSASWLALWGIVECSIAIIIGCCPAFVTIIRRHTSPHISYDTNGFVRQNEESSGEGPDSMKLDSFTTTGTNEAKPTSATGDPDWDVINDSQSVLVRGAKEKDKTENVVKPQPQVRKSIGVRVRKPAVEQ